MKRKNEKTEGFMTNMVNQMVMNVTTQRQKLLRRLTGDDERDLDKELCYPETIETSQYVDMFERSDIAEKVVTLYPDDCWSVDPRVYESDEQESTEFEKKWLEIKEDNNLCHYLHRSDVLSGIGRYGLLFIGINDGKDPNTPAFALGKDGKVDATKQKEREITFVRPFSEDLIQITQWETDRASPRYQHPVMYRILLSNDSVEGETASLDHSLEIHWTRVVHIADQRRSSEVYGTPRMKAVFNRLLDLKKLLGSSAEMFYRGALPGWIFEVDPEFVAAAGLDNTEEGKAFKAGMREEFLNFSEGFQRFMATLGTKAKSLAPQVAAPDKHVMVQIRAISSTLGVPFRIFMGSEQGSLASSQDIRSWNRKLKRRQEQYLTPLLVRPFVQHLVNMGVLPQPERIQVFWPDLDLLSEADKADVADKRIQTLQKYMVGNVGAIYSVKDLFINDFGMTNAEAEMTIKNAEDGLEDFKKLKEAINPIPPEGEFGGGADNKPPGKKSAPQTAKSPSKDRSRTAGGASRTTD